MQLSSLLPLLLACFFAGTTAVAAPLSQSDGASPAGSSQTTTAPTSPDGQAQPVPQTPPQSTPAQSTPAQRTPQVFTKFTPPAPLRYIEDIGSSYIPLDSWMYPELMRLYSLGYLDTVFLGMRPWTRLSVAHMLEGSADAIYNSDNEEAIGIYKAVRYELEPDLEVPYGQKIGHAQIESVYTRVLGISGTPLRDSFHVGQTIINDYGRPYAEGFNNVTGASVRVGAGRLTLHVRGEYQRAPSYPPYSTAVWRTLSTIDEMPLPVVNNDTIPYGRGTNSVSTFRIQEANASLHLAGHEISFGKSDEWFGPGLGGGMGYSNNAEDIYNFRINRVEPLYIPFVSKLLGPVRYDFMLGDLKGHTDPNRPFTHSEGFSFKPTGNFEFGFERTVIWGGREHSPITLHTFLRSFFSISDTTFGQKTGPNDPGARFSDFNFTYRLPFVRKYLTFYTDSEVHDDVTPISAPRRSAIRPGIYLSQFPGMPKLDLRVEAVSTDPPTGRSIHGTFLYWEAIQRQGSTNKGFLFADWIGRESKGGQAWLTYHLSGNEWVQLNYRNAKAAKDFIPGGTTQNDYTVNVVKRLSKNIELNAWVQYESWKAPLIRTGGQSDTSTAVGFTWYPREVARY